MSEIHKSFRQETQDIAKAAKEKDLQLDRQTLENSLQTIQEHTRTIQQKEDAIALQLGGNETLKKDYEAARKKYEAALQKLDVQNPGNIIEWSKQVETLGTQARTELGAALQNILGENPTAAQESITLKSNNLEAAVKEVQQKFPDIVKGYDDMSLGRILLVYLAENKGGPKTGVVEKTTLTDFVSSFGEQAKSGTTALKDLLRRPQFSKYEQGAPGAVDSSAQAYSRIMEAVYDALTQGVDSPLNTEQVQKQLAKNTEQLQYTIAVAPTLQTLRSNFDRSRTEYLQAQIGLEHTLNQLRSIMRDEYATPEERTAQVSAILSKLDIPADKKGTATKEFMEYMAQVTKGMDAEQRQRMDDNEYNRHLFNGISLFATTFANITLSAFALPLGGSGLALKAAITPARLDAKYATTEMYPVQASDLQVAPSFLTGLSADHLKALGVDDTIQEAAKNVMEYRTFLAKEKLLNPTDTARFVVLEQKTPDTITDASIAEAKAAYEQAQKANPDKTVIPSPLVFAEVLPQYAMQRALNALSNTTMNVALAQGVDTSEAQKLLAQARTALQEAQRGETLPSGRQGQSMEAYADSRLQQLVKEATGSVVDRQAMSSGEASMSQEMYRGALEGTLQKNIQERQARIEQLRGNSLLTTLAFVEAQLGNIDIANLTTADLSTIDDAKAAEILQRSGLLQQVREAHALPEFVGDQRITTAFRWPWEQGAFPENMPQNKDTLVKLVQAGHSLLPRAEAHQANALQVEETKLVHISNELQRIQEFRAQNAQLDALTDLDLGGELFQPILKSYEELTRLASTGEDMLEDIKAMEAMQTLDKNNELSGPQMAALRELPSLIATLRTHIDTIGAQIRTLAQLQKEGKTNEAKSMQERIIASLKEQGYANSTSTANKIRNHYTNLLKVVGEQRGEYTFTAEERRDAVAGSPSYNAEATAQNYSDLKARLNWQTKETDADGKEYSVDKDQTIIASIGKGTFNFFETFPTPDQLKDAVPSALIAKGAQVNLDAINHNMTLLTKRKEFGALSAKEKAILTFVETDIRKLTSTVNGLREAGNKTIDGQTYNTLHTDLQRMSKYMLDGTDGNPRTSGESKPKKLTASEVGTRSSEMLQALIGMKTAEFQQGGVQMDTHPDFRDALQKVNNKDYWNILRATTNKEVLKSNAALNLRLQENIYKLQLAVEDINALVQKLGKPSTFTLESFGFKPENPFAGMMGDKPPLVGEVQSFGIQVEAFAKQLYGPEYKGSPQQIKANLLAMNPRALDWASRGRNSFSLVSAITPGSKLRINGKEVAADKKMVRAYNLLVATLPFSHVDRQGNPDTSKQFLPAMKEFFKSQKYGEFSDQQLIEMIGNADGFTNHGEMTKLFNEYLGGTGTKYPSMNFGTRGERSFQGGKITLQKGLFLKLPARHVSINGQMVRIDSAIAFKENCLNPNPSVVTLKMSRVPSAHPGDLPNQVKLEDLPTEVRNHISGGTGKVINIQNTFTAPIIVPYLSGTATPPKSGYTNAGTNTGGEVNNPNPFPNTTP